VNPDLVVRDAKGEIYTVRYEAVNAMLLNEFLKEHKKVEQLEATVAAATKGFSIDCRRAAKRNSNPDGKPERTSRANPESE